jgi:hypothetical protein
MGIKTGTKDGGELSNESEQTGIGGVASSNAGAFGGSGLFGGQGGLAGAFGGLSDAGADLGSFQGGFADGAEDNIFNSVTTINIS